MDGRRAATGATTGALLGALWWGTREFIASGTICSTDDFDCLGMSVIAMPVALVLVLGTTIAWLTYRALGLPRPAPAAIIGAVLTAIFMILTIWTAVPAAAIVTGALGFGIGTAVTGTRRVSETAARD